MTRNTIDSAASTAVDDGEALLHFLYQFPVAVLRMDALGGIDMVNPMAASLLQALALPCGPSDGMKLLHTLDADTADRTLDAIEHRGSIVTQLPLSRRDGQGALRHLALTVTIVHPGACMVTIEDLTPWKAAVEAQRLSDRRYRELVAVIPAGVVVHGPSTEVLMANDEASRVLGLSVEQLQGRLAIDPRWQFEREDGGVLPITEYPVNQVMATGRALEHFVLGIRRPGSDQVVWVMCNASPQLSPTGEVAEVIVSFTEVTKLKQAERDLHLWEERYRLVLKGSNDAPWDWDLVQDSLYYSPRWWQMLGRPADQKATDTGLWKQLLHPDDLERVQSTLSEAIADGRDGVEVECRYQHLDGHYVDVLSRAFILRDRSGTAIRLSGTNFDLSERKRIDAEIHKLAFFDALTGLPNRRRLLDQLGLAVSRSRRSGHHGALLFIDLDRFKELNDTRGHDCGDRLLQQVAQRLGGAVRDTDSVARLGGDEFVVLLELLDPVHNDAAQQAEQVGRKLLDTLAETFLLGQGDYHCSASMGVTLFGPETKQVEALLKQADLAMYQAKTAGAGSLHFFDDSLQAAVEQRVALEADLRSALQHDELVLHFQAQVNREQGVTGAEVLLRWQHPQRGLMPPALFIPVAEATGLILPMGRWVLKTACQQLARWANQASFAHLSLSVNVSVHQFHDPGFVDQVIAVLRETGANPQRLRLELTESALARSIEEIIGKMDRLKREGVSFSLDDFGTGYSSLGYLKRLPLDELKIDRSFVKDVTTDGSDATLSRIIITLAHQFGLSVIAEGVETIEQRRFLEHNGCVDFQGFLYSRPLQVADFETLAVGFENSRR